MCHERHLKVIFSEWLLLVFLVRDLLFNKNNVISEFVILAHNGHAVLFSNDQNLCSKAIINGVKAFNHQV